MTNLTIKLLLFLSTALQLVPTWGPSSNAKLTVIDGDGLGLGDDDADGKGMGFGKGRPRITNKDDLIQATIRRTKSHTWTAEIMSKYPITNKWHLFAKEVKDTPGKIKIVNNEDPLTSSITIMDGVRADTGPYRYVLTQ